MVEVKDGDGNVMTGVEITWSTDASEVATVDADGLIIAAGAGTAMITATAGDLSASITVTVDRPPEPKPAESADDRAALVAFYESVGCDNWVISANWVSDKPMAEWYGISINHEGRVVAIALGNNGLEGSIPPEIGQLTGMLELFMGLNGLSGSLPSELGNLTNLEVLLLFNNQFSGPIPLELTSLPNLAFLDASYNQLSGPIPQELSMLNALEILALDGNQLSGAIPPEIGNIDGLQTLRLSSNHPSITPDPVPHVSEPGHRLTGPVPSALGNLVSLSELDISYNTLLGTLPASLTMLSLRRFWWSGNPDLCLPGTAEFSVWIDDIALHDGGQYCDRTDRAALDALYEAAGGSGWTVSDGWPDGPLESRHGISVDSSNRVIAIDLSANGLVGELPLELGDLKVLSELRLGGNPQLSGRLPYTLPRIETLRELRYAGTDLCVPREVFLRDWLDGVPEHEGTGVDCPPSEERDVLERIYDSMSGNRWHDSSNWLTDAPLREWHGVKADGQGRVVGLDLTHNGLIGPIPADIGALEKLTDLQLFGNDTRGSPLPTELGELANLEFLNLAGIFAAGSIPPRIGKLSNLKVLDLSGNELSSSIPPELGNLTSLVELHLGNNRLVGSLPQQLADAAELRQIHVPDNDLSGALRHEIDIPSSPGPVPTRLDESSLERSADATVPADIVQPGLEVVIEIDPEGTLDDRLEVARRIPETGRLAVEMREMPTFDVTFVPLLWETNLDMSVVDLVNDMEANPMGHEMLGLTRTLLPVADIQVTAHASVRTSNNAGHELIGETQLIATMEGRRQLLHGTYCRRVFRRLGNRPDRREGRVLHYRLQRDRARIRAQPVVEPHALRKSAGPGACLSLPGWVNGTLGLRLRRGAPGVAGRIR